VLREGLRLGESQKGKRRGPPAGGGYRQGKGVRERGVFRNWRRSRPDHGKISEVGTRKEEGKSDIERTAAYTAGESDR